MPPRTISHEPAAERAPSPPPTFVAIDFETADYGRDSACALALVRVEAGSISALELGCSSCARVQAARWHWCTGECYPPAAASLATVSIPAIALAATASKICTAA